KADAVTVIIPHRAVPDNRPETAIKKNAAATATVQIHILLFVAIDDQIFNARTLKVVAADHGKHRRSLRFVRKGAIRVEGFVDRESISVLSFDARNGRVKATGLF